jgi:hypothetical protein
MDVTRPTAVDAENVEDHVRQRDRGVPLQDAFAQLREVGLAVSNERDEFAVEHRPHRELREEPDVLRHVPATTAADTQLAFCRDDRPEPVPLQLVGEVAARRQPAGAGEHRFGKAAVRP